MTFVASSGTVRSLERPSPLPPTRLRLTDDYSQDYAEIWRTQPAVRTVVSFLARNIASLGIHFFERVSDDDRRRLTTGVLPELFARPNPRTTPYSLINSLVHDLGIFDTAYWLKLDDPALLRLPPRMVKPLGESWMWAEQFELRGGKGVKVFDAEQVVHMHGFNPDDARIGCSPIESLRRILAEEYEAGRMREQTLRNGARASGYLERPANAPEWTSAAREKFRKQWHAQYAGNGPQAGGTPILEDGMKFTPASQTSEQLQYIEARKLTREEVAAAYFIPPPMVGILDHATFGNIEEQHKMLYQDTLGPWLTFIGQEIDLQLIGDLAPSSSIYVEFNLAEKLKGSFEEQAKALQTATGAPWLLRSEARARMNLPFVDGMDSPVTPLNVLIGGQASPTDSAPKSASALPSPGRLHVKARAPQTYEAKYAEVVAGFFGRQQQVVASKLGADAEDWWDQERWDTELGADLYALAVQTTGTVGAEVAESLGADAGEYDTDVTLAFLAAVTKRASEEINSTTKEQLDEALTADDVDAAEAAVEDVFTKAKESRTEQIATTAITALSGFATVEAAKQIGGVKATKTWVTGPKPRPAHAAMNGETVGLEETFSNGLPWPGSFGDADQVAGCNCSLQINLP